ncbi:MAG TPA: HDOD domain-containing protein [Phycisphaerales bacterium]|nr:HDOD domain-containing protein [Phycisphaerales bacterium]
MKPRAKLTAAEVASLYESLDRRLDAIGIETQPQVAAQILELTGDPTSGLAQYAEVLRTDAALSGRLLRMVNSAFFAQRSPVTTVDRACVLLGIGRLRAVALGFYLSRAAASSASQTISREVWGQSVFRACFAAELARRVCPMLASEAFVVGLMLDAGLPLMHKLLGSPFDAIYSRRLSPAGQYRVETETLPYTHVDLVTTLVRRWRLPEVLARPIEWHHVHPSETESDASSHRLHPVAYFAGVIDLADDGSLRQQSSMPTLAASVLGLTSEEVGNAARAAAREYRAVLSLFDGVADAVSRIDTLAERVHAELIDLVDSETGRGFEEACRARTMCFNLGGGPVEIEAEPGGGGTIYMLDSTGGRLASYRFDASHETPDSLRSALGLEPTPNDETEGVARFLRDLAA